MKQGSTFVLIVNLNIDLSRIDSVIFTLKNKDVTLTKENWTYNNGKFELPFTQEETVQLQGRTRIEAQINFADGNVAKTQIKDIYIQETLATRIIEDNIATQEGKEVELNVEESVIFTSEDYSKLANKPKINGVVLLGDVSLDSLNIASKEYVEEEIAKFDFIKVVDVLPEIGLPNRVYYVPKTNGGKNDLFDEYAWINGDWEFYGTKQIEVDLSEYVKNTDYAFNKVGVVKIQNVSSGLQVNPNSGEVSLSSAPKSVIDEKSNTYRAITPSNLDYAVKKALSDCKLTDDDVWTEEEKAKALELLGGVNNSNVKMDAFAMSIVQRDGGGRVLTQNPITDGHATTKKYVDDNFIKKLKPYNNSVLMFKGGETGETELGGYTNSYPYRTSFYRLANASEGDTIQGDGYFLSNMPLKPYHTANKKYVDDLIAELRAEIEALKG